MLSTLPALSLFWSVGRGEKAGCSDDIDGGESKNDNSTNSGQLEEEATFQVISTAGSSK